MTDNTQPLALWLAEAKSVAYIAIQMKRSPRHLGCSGFAVQPTRPHRRAEAKIKTMAEEHADELMVAHMDGMWPDSLRPSRRRRSRWRGT